mmetsp:Transcript_102525/g.295162  ORF Transcript_102525/g.295162 Transcript_102525/m.295162 type:complete len:290 (+) Transcript_102525:358-1227(+)
MRAGHGGIGPQSDSLGVASTRVSDASAPRHTTRPQPCLRQRRGSLQQKRRRPPPGSPRRQPGMWRTPPRGARRQWGLLRTLQAVRPAGGTCSIAAASPRAPAPRTSRRSSGGDAASLLASVATHSRPSARRFLTPPAKIRRAKHSSFVAEAPVWPGCPRSSASGVARPTASVARVFLVPRRPRRHRRRRCRRRRRGRRRQLVAPCLFSCLSMPGCSRCSSTGWASATTAPTTPWPRWMSIEAGISTRMNSWTGSCAIGCWTLATTPLLPSSTSTWTTTSTSGRWSSMAP